MAGRRSQEVEEKPQCQRNFRTSKGGRQKLLSGFFTLRGVGVGSPHFRSGFLSRMILGPTPLFPKLFWTPSLALFVRLDISDQEEQMLFLRIASLLYGGGEKVG